MVFYFLQAHMLRGGFETIKHLVNESQIFLRNNYQIRLMPYKMLCLRNGDVGESKGRKR